MGRGFLFVRNYVRALYRYFFSFSFVSLRPTAGSLGGFSTWRTSRRGEIGDIARSTACKETSSNTYWYAETCPGRRATVQGRIRIDIIGNVRPMASFVLSRSLLYFVWNTLMRSEIKCTCTQLRAWHAEHGRIIAIPPRVNCTRKEALICLQMTKCRRVQI